MGSPPQPSAAQLQQLHEASELAPQPVPLGACLQGPACLNSDARPHNDLDRFLAQECPCKAQGQGRSQAANEAVSAQDAAGTKRTGANLALKRESQASLLQSLRPNQA